MSYLRGELSILSPDNRMGLAEQQEVDICCMHIHVSSEAGSLLFYVTTSCGDSPKDHDDSFCPYNLLIF